MILFVQNLCSATREVLKCTTRYSSSFEEDGLLGLIRLGFRSPLDMLPGGLLSGGASPRAAYQSAALSAAHATQQPNGNLRTTRNFPTSPRHSACRMPQISGVLRRLRSSSSDKHAGSKSGIYSLITHQLSADQLHGSRLAAAPGRVNIGAHILVPELRFWLGKKPSCVHFSVGVAQL